MAVSVQETIAALIVARLESMTTANSYNFDVESVNRVNRDGSQWTPRHYSVTVALQSDVRFPDYDHEGNPPAIGYQATWAIVGYVRQTDRETTTQMTLLNNFIASIRQALAVDSTWHNWGGNAIDSDFGDASIEEYSDGEHVTVNVPLEVFYRVSETDPFTSRS